MPLPPGSKLGPYEVLSLLGAGGMGEVYRARDPRLSRDVAIKVLHADRMADENRRRRFVQEARSASALNHPNIVTIHEIDAVDGIDFIVMEYVPGKSLDALIPRQGMRLGEVLRTAIPMADALARAHARGIVHRDLKPANVMVSNEGVVKVLDFGLAKLVFPDEVLDERDTVNPDATTLDSASLDTASMIPPTLDTAASPLSQPGRVEGTAGYMSPEQATAAKVDSRSDIFAFGAVLYEMVTGRRAFLGSSTAETLAAVVREHPKAPSDVVAGVPRDLDRLIQRCLRKEPDRRFQHMVDVKVELNEIKEESDSAPAAAAVPAKRHRFPWLVVGLVGALGVIAAAWLRPPPPTVLLLPARLEPLTSTRGWEQSPTFSPDGNQIAFSWSGEKGLNWDVYLKIVGSSEIRRLTSDPAEDLRPSWSPDGRQIAFVRHFRGAPDEVRLVSPLGGPERKLNDFPVGGGNLAWSPDGRWLAATRQRGEADTEVGAGSIHFLPVEGGEPRRVTSPRGLDYDVEPTFSPNGRRLAYASCVNSLSCWIQLLDLGPDGLPQAPPRRLPNKAVWLSGLAWARDGNSLVYGDDRLGQTLWRIGVSGERLPERIEIAGLKTGQPVSSVSRDRLAFVRYFSDVDIYRFVEGRPPEIALASSFDDYGPSFSPDGRRIAFGSGRSGQGQEIWLAAADGTDPVQLTHGPGLVQGSPRFSPDGRQIAFDSQGEDGHWDIYLMDPDGGSLRRLTRDPGDENQPSWSQDGRFVYFNSDRAGGHEVWRIPAAGGSEERLTQGGGDLAYESADGRTLFFKRAAADSPLLALPLAGGAARQILDCVPRFGFAVGPGGVYHFGCKDDVGGRPLSSLDPLTGRDRLLGKLDKGSGGLTVSPDGKTILYTKEVGEGSDLMMIENFR